VLGAAKSVGTPDFATVARERSRFRISLPLLVGLLCYTGILVTGDRVLSDPDTYWHIAVGRWIITHRAMMHQDVFSFSMPGAPFTPPEWLAEVLIAWIYDHFGWAGLVATTAFSAAAAAAMLLRVLLRTLTPVHALIATMLAAAVVVQHLLARPHIFALPILVVWTAALVRARSENRAPSLWLAALITLWANIHSSYIVGIGLAGLLGAEAVILAPDWPARLRAARAWGLFGSLSIAAALITPFGIDGLVLPFQLLQMSFAFSMVVEWLSPNFQQFQAVEVWIMFLLFAGLSLGWRLPPTRVGIVLVLLHMALAHMRYAEQLGVIAPLLLAPALSPQLERRSGGYSASSLDRRLAALARPATGRGILLAGAILLAVSATVLRAGVAHDSGAITPTAALAAVEAHHVEGPVLNDYGFGGYLIFRGIKPFIDGRYFYGDPFIKRHFKAVAALDNELPGLLSQYDIRWTLIPPTEPGVTLLDHLPGWRRLYADDVAVVHVREDQASR
jgi:hypothetical protein